MKATYPEDKIRWPSTFKWYTQMYTKWLEGKDFNTQVDLIKTYVLQGTNYLKMFEILGAFEGATDLNWKGDITLLRYWRDVWDWALLDTGKISITTITIKHFDNVEFTGEVYSSWYTFNRYLDRLTLPERPGWDDVTPIKLEIAYTDNTNGWEDIRLLHGRYENSLGEELLIPMLEELWHTAHRVESGELESLKYYTKSQNEVRRAYEINKIKTIRDRLNTYELRM